MARRKNKRLGFTDERHEREEQYMTQAGQRALDRANERISAGNCKGALDDLGNAFFYAGSAIQHSYSGAAKQSKAYALEKSVGVAKEKFFARCSKRK